MCEKHKHVSKLSRTSSEELSDISKAYKDTFEDYRGASACSRAMFEE